MGDAVLPGSLLRLLPLSFCRGIGTLAAMSFILSLHTSVLAADDKPLQPSFLKSRTASFDKIPLSDTGAIKLEIENTGAADVGIDKVLSSDPQVVIADFPAKVPKGKSGTISIVIWPRQASKIDSKVEIFYGDGTKEAAKVTGEIVSPEEKTGTGSLSEEKILISVEKFSELVGSRQDVVVVDTRNAEEFKEYRIKDSINMPVQSIRGSKWLEKKKIVLVDNGFDRHPLVEAASLLSKTGFDVLVLDGGINAWWRSGHEIYGYPKLMSVSGISPAQLFLCAHRKGVVIVNLAGGATGSEILDKMPSFEVSLAGKEQFIGEWKKAYEKTPPSRIVICDNDEKKYLLVDSYLREIGVKNVFYLDGGINAFKLYVRKFVSGKKTEFVTSLTDCGCK